ncbi:hypothetical protein RCZ04_09720 [Capnocytophaga sp. HP1101]
MKTLRTNARITEVADTGARLSILFSRETALAKDVILKPLFAEIETLTQQLSEAIKSDRTLSELDAIDTQRDELIRRVSKILQGYAASPIEALQSSGSKLNAVFEKYGVSIARENYAVESAHIESFLKDFADPALATDISALTGVAEIITMLTNTQKDFNDHRVTYEQALAQRSSKLKTGELKKLLLLRINHSLLPYLTTLKSLNNAPYLHFIEGVNQTIISTNSAIAARSKKSTHTPSPTDKPQV